MIEAWRYELTLPATCDLRQLNAVGRQRIFAALDRLIANNIIIEQEAPPGTGERGVHIIDVLRVLPRGRAYRN